MNYTGFVKLSWNKEKVTEKSLQKSDLAMKHNLCHHQMNGFMGVLSINKEVGFIE